MRYVTLSFSIFSSFSLPVDFYKTSSCLSPGDLKRHLKIHKQAGMDPGLQACKQETSVTELDKKMIYEITDPSGNDMQIVLLQGESDLPESVGDQEIVILQSDTTESSGLKNQPEIAEVKVEAPPSDREAEAVVSPLPIVPVFCNLSQTK